MTLIPAVLTWLVFHRVRGQLAIRKATLAAASGHPSGRCVDVWADDLMSRLLHQNPVQSFHN